MELLINLPIDEITDFIQERELEEVSTEILTPFAELKRRNFIIYISDSKAYSEALQKRETEYNALILRMRKDLNKK